MMNWYCIYTLVVDTIPAHSHAQMSAFIKTKLGKLQPSFSQLAAVCNFVFPVSKFSPVQAINRRFMFNNSPVLIIILGEMLWFYCPVQSEHCLLKPRSVHNLQHKLKLPTHSHTHTSSLLTNYIQMGKDRVPKKNEKATTATTTTATSTEANNAAATTNAASDKGAAKGKKGANTKKK